MYYESSTTYKVTTQTTITSSVQKTTSFQKSISSQSVEEDYEKQITIMKEEFNTQISTVKRENFELGNERNDLRVNNKKCLEELNDLKAKIRAAEIELQQLKQKQARMVSDDQEKKRQQLSLEEKINSTKMRLLENEMQDSTYEEKISIQQDRIFQLQMELDDFKFEDSKNENTIRSYEMQLQLVIEEILQLRKTLADMEARVQEKEQHKVDTNSEKESALIKITYIEQEKEEVIEQLNFKLSLIENLYKKISDINDTVDSFSKKSDIAKANIKVYEKRYNDALVLKSQFDSKVVISQNDLEAKKVKLENLDSLSKSKDDRIRELNIQISGLERNISEYNLYIVKGEEQIKSLRADIDFKIKLIDEAKAENRMDDSKIIELGNYVEKQRNELDQWMAEYNKDELEIHDLEDKIQKRVQKIFDAKILLVDLSEQFNYHFSVTENLSVQDEESLQKIEQTELTTEKISTYNNIIKYKSHCISNLKAHCEKLNEIVKKYKEGNSELKVKLEDMKIEKKRVTEKKQVESTAVKSKRETLVSYSKKDTEEIYLTKVAEIKTSNFKKSYVQGSEDFEASLRDLENYVNAISIKI